MRGRLQLIHVRTLLPDGLTSTFLLTVDDAVRLTMARFHTSTRTGRFVDAMLSVHSSSILGFPGSKLRSALIEKTVSELDSQYFLTHNAIVEKSWSGLSSEYEYQFMIG